jgi:hypothetical protein
VTLKKSTSRTIENLQWNGSIKLHKRGLQYQQIKLLKILQNPIWRDVMLALCELEDAQNMLNNLSKGWQHIKGCHSKDDQCVQNVVIPMVLGFF